MCKKIYVYNYGTAKIKTVSVKKLVELINQDLYSKKLFLNKKDAEKEKKEWKSKSNE